MILRLAIAAALLLAVAVGMPPIASADAGCTLYAAPAAHGGNDANPGTKAQPKESPFALLEALQSGQTGCLEDGATFALGGGEAITATAGALGQPKILRPETPGKRATIDASTGFWFKTASHDITLKDLNLRRSGGGGGSLLLLDGDRLTLEGVDASYPYNICIDIGEDPRAGALDPAEDIVIRRSRIHHCGSEYGPPHFNGDSGVHGIYVQFTRHAVIEDNLIYANHNRGIQLYPDADDTIIRYNVLHANGANLNIGSERGLQIYSENNLVENNILTDSTLSGLQGGFIGDTSEVLGNFPPPGPAVPDFNNRVVRNCISNATYPNELYEGYGFTQAENVENQDPRYVNPDAGDFTLAPGSPCAGKGPRAAASGPLVLSAPVTDNYKACFNGVHAPREKRTFLQFGTIVAGGVAYTPTEAPPADGFLFKSTADPLPLTGSDGGSATLSATTTSANVSSSFFRVDGASKGGAWGLLVQLGDPAQLAQAPVVFTLTISKNGAAVATTTVEYRYEAAIYNAGPEPANCPDTAPPFDITIEWNGPGGRWWLPSPANETWLNWEPNGCMDLDYARAHGYTPVLGGKGSNVLTSRANRSLMVGGKGADVILMPTGADADGVVCAGGGNDVVRKGVGDGTQVDGGAGHDTFSFSLAAEGCQIDLSTAAPKFVWCGNHAQSVVDGFEVAEGSPYGDQIKGDAKTDALSGGGGNDELSGGAGNETLDGGLGADSIAGGGGIDTVTFGSRTAAVKVSLDGIANDGDPVSPAGGEKDNVATTVENVTGGAGNDVLTGSSAANALAGAAGSDVLRGGTGNDRLDGASGIDTADYGVAGGAVSVNLMTASSGGAEGADTLPGIENVTGSAYADTLAGNASANVLSGGGGNDLLRGRAGNDKLSGGTGTDTADYVLAGGAVKANLATSSASGADGVDTFSAIENLTGSAYGDTLIGNGSPNALAGAGGNDLIDGALGVDVFRGDAGNDSIKSRDGTGENVYCGVGTDALTADPGDLTPAQDCENIQRG